MIRAGLLASLLVGFTLARTADADVLIGHWAFEETSGTTVFDSAVAGGADDGTVVASGVNMNVAGPTGFGNAISFNETSLLPITITGNTVQDLFGGNANSFSVTGWFLAQTSGVDDNKYAFGGSGAGAFTLNLSGALLQVDRILQSIDSRVTASPSVVGAWHHIALVNGADSKFDWGTSDNCFSEPCWGLRNVFLCFVGHGLAFRC